MPESGLKDIRGWIDILLEFCTSDSQTECYVFQFEDPRDAEDAIHYRDGYNFDGFRLRVSDMPFLINFVAVYVTLLDISWNLWFLLCHNRWNLHMVGGVLHQ